MKLTQIIVPLVKIPTDSKPIVSARISLEKQLAYVFPAIPIAYIATTPNVPNV